MVPDEINELLGRFEDNYTISALYDYKEETFKYMLCQFLPKGLKIPNGDVQGMWKRIWTEWFPTSGYESVKGVSFEMYYGLASHHNAHAEIWVPVMKKEG